jgi:hypothetical protein
VIVRAASDLRDRLKAPGRARRNLHRALVLDGETTVARQEKRKNRMGHLLTEVKDRQYVSLLVAQADGSNGGCSICLGMLAQFDASEGRLHLTLPPGVTLPAELDVAVLTTAGEGAETRGFLPGEDAVGELRDFRRADWYLPVGMELPALVEVKLFFTFSENDTRVRGTKRADFAA